MQYTGNIDFASMFGGQSRQQEQDLTGLAGQLGIQNQAAYSASIQDQAFAEQVNRIVNDPNWNGGQYTFTEADLRAARKGEATSALKTAELVKRYAELFGIPLEEFDPDNPYLNSMLSTNEWDTRRLNEQFAATTPSEYQYGYNPANDTFFDKLMKGGSRVQETKSYEAGKNIANEAMYQAGMSGDEIAKIQLQNELYNRETKGLDKTNNLQKFFGLDANNKSTSQGKLSPEATAKAKQIWDKNFK